MTKRHSFWLTVKKKNVSVKEKQGEMCEQRVLELKNYYFKTIPSFTACENAMKTQWKADLDQLT